MKKMIPMQGYVILKKDTPENVTSNGFYLPESAAEKDLSSGKVFLCGKEVEGVDSKDITEGATVLFVKWAASELEFEGEKYQLIRYEDVKLVIKDETVS